MNDSTPSRSTGLGWCGGAIAAAVLALAIGNADSARNWTEGLRPGAWSQPMRDGAERWADFTRSAGLSVVRDEIRGLWEHRHEVGWAGLAKARADRASAP